MSDLVKRLRQGCDCSEKVCEMDTFSELAADRIEELERVRAHDLEQEQVLLKRIEELEASTIHAKYVSAMGLIKACKPYLKDGETPAECIQRNRSDVGSVMSLLAKEKFRIEAALEIVEWLTDLHDDMHEYGGQTWSKQLAPKLDKLREALTGGKDESR